MGLDVHGKLIGNVRHEEVFNFIRQKIDANAVDYVKSEEHDMIKVSWGHIKYGECDKWVTTSGFISFTTKDGNSRSLFYCYDNINSLENLKYYSDLGLADMVKAETTFISLGYNGEAVEIIKQIVAHFGGWIDENDCDDTPYYPILKNDDGSLKPVIEVTMNDIYDKFNAVVIIKK